MPYDSNTEVTGERLWQSEEINWGATEERNVMPILTRALERMVVMAKATEDGGHGAQEERVTGRYNESKKIAIDMGNALVAAGVPIDSMRSILVAVTKEAQAVYAEWAGAPLEGGLLHPSRYNDILRSVAATNGLALDLSSPKPSLMEALGENTANVVVKKFGDKLGESQEEMEHIVKSGVVRLFKQLEAYSEATAHDKSSDNGNRAQAELWKVALTIRTAIETSLLEHRIPDDIGEAIQGQIIKYALDYHEAVNDQRPNVGMPLEAYDYLFAEESRQYQDILQERRDQRDSRVDVKQERGTVISAIVPQGRANLFPAEAIDKR